MNDFDLSLRILASCQGVRGVVVSWEPSGWLMLPPQGWAMFADLIEWADRELEHWLMWLEEGYGPDDFLNLMYEEALTGVRAWLSLADSDLIADILHEEKGQSPGWVSEFRGAVNYLLDRSQIAILTEALASGMEISFSLPDYHWSDLAVTVEEVNTRLAEIREIIERWSGDPVGATLHEELEGTDEALAEILPLLQREDLRTAYSCAGHFGLINAPSGKADSAVVASESYLSFWASPAGVEHVRRLAEELKQALPACHVRCDARSDGGNATQISVYVSYLPEFHPDEYIETDDPEWFEEQQQVFLRTLTSWAEALPTAGRRLF
jgi:hypothetical protein